MSGNSKKQRGISLLLEAVFGMALVGVAVLFIFGLFPSSHRAVTQSKNYTLANDLVRETMELERQKGFGGVSDYGPISVPRDAVIDGAPVTTRFRITVQTPVLTTQASDGYDSRHLLVTVEWDEAEITRNVRLESVLVQL